MDYLKQFGGKITDQHKATYSNSKNWDGKQFINLEPTAIEVSFQNLPKLLKKQLSNRKFKTPTTPIPIIPFNIDEFLEPSQHLKFIWYGHSVVLLRLNGKTILIDPMLGDNASPIAPITTKRFSDNSIDIIDQLPEIDLVLFTHDHYDHLDYASVVKLKSKVKHYFVALGVDRHLERWGIDTAKMTTFDWWQQQQFIDINISFTPTRHFSGRGLSDRAKTLWGGWVLQTPTENIYFSGDGGYGNHFKTIGETFKHFDFAFMECGQYNEHWHKIHMYPEEAVQAAIDVNAKKAMPVHWAGFSLALHAWTEPIERFIEAANQQNLPIIYPKIGKLITAYSNDNNSWWKQYL
ncbi:MAG: MBL fold metallo-hydrolase [Chitinophagales bacterium]|nr:MBL fold metallo-hydrolase [Chitinophagales bacterium]